jgi:hypothetical protein
LFEIEQKIHGLVDPDDPINFDPKQGPHGEYGGLEVRVFGSFFVAFGYLTTLNIYGIPSRFKANVEIEFTST